VTILGMCRARRPDSGGTVIVEKSVRRSHGLGRLPINATIQQDVARSSQGQFVVYFTAVVVRDQAS